jgi:hypothetical protein
MKKLVTSVLACVLFVPSALAASGPWDGTWKLDISKSHFEGTSFTYSKTPTGMWHYSDGAATVYDFAADGKPYKTLDADDTVTVTSDGDHAWIIVSKFKGKETSTTREELSADGKTLTDHAKNTRPDGSTSESTVVMTRVSGGPGFAGKWRSTKVEISVPDSYIISTPAPGVIKWDIPAYKEGVEGKIDGTPLKITGPTVPDGLTLTLTKAGEKELKYLVKLKSKVLEEGHMTLAADGKSFTDIGWSPGKMDEKATAVYIKQ